MYRNEFIENITDWAELLSFCQENDLDACRDIYPDSTVEEEIEDDIASRECDWRELRDALDDISVDGYYYLRRGWLDYVCVDDEFEDYKRDVLSECDDWEGFWEVEEIAEDEEEEDWFDLFSEEEPEEEPEPEEELPDFSVLLSICESSIRIISQ